MKKLSLLLLTGLVFSTAACGAGASRRTGPVKVVAAFYPLAWAARQVAPSAQVEDLTPPGGEPHDIQLNARQRQDVADADIVLILGDGFQPALERASRDARGKVVDLLVGLPLVQSNEQGLKADPHVWLDPALMQSLVSSVGAAFAGADPVRASAYSSRTSALVATLGGVDEQYRRGLASCRLKTVVTTHEAFGYLAREYGLSQLGLTGLTPEAEPSAASLQQARRAVHDGDARAIFYEATDEGRRIGRSVARDLGVPALPLNTLEQDPAPLDYLSAVGANLTSLEKGLACR